VGAPSQKLYLKNGIVENLLNRGDGFPSVKLPKNSGLFDNNLSLSVGGAPSQKLYLKRHGRKFFKSQGWIPQDQITQNQSFI
jgi:hypothetical protein